MKTKNELLEYGRNYYHNVYKHKLNKKSKRSHNEILEYARNYYHNVYKHKNKIKINKKSKRSYNEILEYARNYYHNVYKHKLNENKKDINIYDNNKKKVSNTFSKINNPITIHLN